MCGIAGIYNFGSDERLDTKIIHRMCEKLIHRGPDDYGIYVKEPVGLGHRRLTIIDLSSKAKQPMSNEDGSIWITFNGEIYNFHEIRDDLIKKGHLFRTKSDTEVIIHAYEEYGPGCLDKFIGMFAFAIWDGNRRRIFLARDRIGKKPLVYYLSNKFFIFASEIKAILEDPRVPRKVNLQAMNYYFTFGYVPSPETMFKDIKKLPPGHFLVLQNGNMKVKRYWNISSELNEIPTELCKEEDIERQLESLLEDSVRFRMVSDVPVGAFLSGGIGSSLVVALMCRISPEPVQTFTIGFEEEAFNEAPFARIVADQFKTKHREIILTADAVEILPKLIWHYNEPFGDSSAIPTYYLSQMTSSYVKVVLSGDGGDELFGGYNRYITLDKLKYYDYVPKSLAYLVRKAINQPIENYWATYNHLGLTDRIEKALNIRFLSTEKRNFYLLCLSNLNFRKKLFSEEVNREIRGHHSPEDFYHGVLDSIKSKDKMNRIFASDVYTYLPDDLLVKVDIASMAHSLEVRCPLIDHRLVNFALKIPAHYKVKSGQTKYILKRLAYRLLPAKTLKRTKKGFSIPIDNWFRTDLRGLVEEAVSNNSQAVRSFFNPARIREIIYTHQTCHANYGRSIWLILNFLLWYERFITRRCI